MHIALWLLVCISVSFALRQRPLVVVGVALTVWVLFPAVASPILTGPLPGSFALRAGTWFILCALFIQVVANPRSLAEEIGRRFGTYLCLLLVVSEAVLLARLSSDKGGSVIVFDQVLGPIILFLMVGAAVGTGRASILLLRNWIIALAVFEVVFAIAQYIVRSTIIYQSYYASFPFFHASSNTRWMGTTEDPLALSLLICVAVPLLAGLRRASMALPLLGLMGAGLLITQSRTGLVVFALGAIYVVLAAKVTIPAKFSMLSIMVVAAYLAGGSALASGVQGRLANDTGSSGARSAAWSFFAQRWTDYAFNGDGISSSYDVSRQAGLQSSLESSVLMYAVGIGVVFTVIYFGTQALIVARSAFAGPPRGAVFAGLVLLVVPQTYSALATESLAGPLLWVGLAVAAAGSATVLRDSAQLAPDPAGIYADKAAAAPSAAVDAGSAVTDSAAN